jgi:hypothetical protein
MVVHGYRPVPEGNGGPEHTGRAPARGGAVYADTYIRVRPSGRVVVVEDPYPGTDENGGFRNAGGNEILYVPEVGAAGRGLPSGRARGRRFFR